MGVRLGARGARDRLVRGALRPLHRRGGGRAAVAVLVHDRLPRRPRSRSPRSRRRGRRTSRSRWTPPARRSSRGAPGSRPSARRCSSASRASCRSASRELAVAESLDGGKPIKESRDVDLPLAAAHFFYYAGWADKLEYAFPSRRPRPLGVAAQIVPWNFPLLMLAWKIAPALACGNTVVLKPAETTPLTALLFADVCRQARGAPRRRQHRHGRRRDRRAPRPQPRDRQGRVHRLDRGREGDPARARRARDIPLTLELGGKAANIVFEDCGARPGRRGDRQRHLLQPGPRLLRGLAAPRPGVDPRPARAQAEAPHGDAAPRRPARQEHRHRRDQLEGAARPDHGARRERAPRRARRSTSRRAGCPRRAGGSRRRCSRTSRRATASPGGDLRPRAQRAHVPHAGRGGREGEQHDVRALGGGLDGEGLADPLDGRPAARRRRLGEHVQPLRPGLAVRRLQGVRLRPRGRPPRARGRT